MASANDGHDCGDGSDATQCGTFGHANQFVSPRLGPLGAADTGLAEVGEAVEWGCQRWAKLYDESVNILMSPKTPGPELAVRARIVPNVDTWDLRIEVNHEYQQYPLQSRVSKGKFVFKQGGKIPAPKGWGVNINTRLNTLLVEISKFNVRLKLTVSLEEAKQMSARQGPAVKRPRRPSRVACDKDGAHTGSKQNPETKKYPGPAPSPRVPVAASGTTRPTMAKQMPTEKQPKQNMRNPILTILKLDVMECTNDVPGPLCHLELAADEIETTATMNLSDSVFLNAERGATIRKNVAANFVRLKGGKILIEERVKATTQFTFVSDTVSNIVIVQVCCELLETILPEGQTVKNRMEIRGIIVGTGGKVEGRRNLTMVVRHHNLLIAQKGQIGSNADETVTLLAREAKVFNFGQFRALPETVNVDERRSGAIRVWAFEFGDVQGVDTLIENYRELLLQNHNQLSISFNKSRPRDPEKARQIRESLHALSSCRGTIKAPHVYIFCERQLCNLCQLSGSGEVVATCERNIMIEKDSALDVEKLKMNTVGGKIHVAGAIRAAHANLSALGGSISISGLIEIKTMLVLASQCTPITPFGPVSRKRSISITGTARSSTVVISVSETDAFLSKTGELHCRSNCELVLAENSKFLTEGTLRIDGQLSSAVPPSLEDRIVTDRTRALINSSKTFFANAVDCRDCVIVNRTGSRISARVVRAEVFINERAAKVSTRSICALQLLCNFGTITNGCNHAYAHQDESKRTFVEVDVTIEIDRNLAKLQIEIPSESQYLYIDAHHLIQGSSADLNQQISAHSGWKAWTRNFGGIPQNLGQLAATTRPRMSLCGKSVSGSDLYIVTRAESILAGRLQANHRVCVYSNDEACFLRGVISGCQSSFVLGIGGYMRNQGRFDVHSISIAGDELAGGDHDEIVFSNESESPINVDWINTRHCKLVNREKAVIRAAKYVRAADLINELQAVVETPLLCGGDTDSGCVNFGTICSAYSQNNLIVTIAHILNCGLLVGNAVKIESNFQQRRIGAIVASTLSDVTALSDSNVIDGVIRTSVAKFTVILNRMNFVGTLSSDSCLIILHTNSYFHNSGRLMCSDQMTIRSSTEYPNLVLGNCGFVNQSQHPIITGRVESETCCIINSHGSVIETRNEICGCKIENYGLMQCLEIKGIRYEDNALQRGMINFESQLRNSGTIICSSPDSPRLRVDFSQVYNAGVLQALSVFARNTFNTGRICARFFNWQDDEAHAQGHSALTNSDVGTIKIVEDLVCSELRNRGDIQAKRIAGQSLVNVGHLKSSDIRLGTPCSESILLNIGVIVPLRIMNRHTLGIDAYEVSNSGFLLCSSLCASRFVNSGRINARHLRAHHYTALALTNDSIAINAGTINLDCEMFEESQPNTPSLNYHHLMNLNRGNIRGTILCVRLLKNHGNLRVFTIRSDMDPALALATESALENTATGTIMSPAGEKPTVMTIYVRSIDNRGSITCEAMYSRYIVNTSQIISSIIRGHIIDALAATKNTASTFLSSGEVKPERNKQLSVQFSTIINQGMMIARDVRFRHFINTSQLRGFEMSASEMLSSTIVNAGTVQAIGGAALRIHVHVLNNRSSLQCETLHVHTMINTGNIVCTRLQGSQLTNSGDVVVDIGQSANSSIVNSSSVQANTTIEGFQTISNLKRGVISSPCVRCDVLQNEGLFCGSKGVIWVQRMHQDVKGQLCFTDCCQLNVHGDSVIQGTVEAPKLCLQVGDMDLCEESAKHEDWPYSERKVQASIESKMVVVDCTVKLAKSIVALSGDARFADTKCTLTIQTNDTSALESSFINGSDFPLVLRRLICDCTLTNQVNSVITTTHPLEVQSLVNGKGASILAPALHAQHFENSQLMNYGEITYFDENESNQQYPAEFTITYEEIRNEGAIRMKTAHGGHLVVQADELNCDGCIKSCETANDTEEDISVSVPESSLMDNQGCGQGELYPWSIEMGVTTKIDLGCTGTISADSCVRIPSVPGSIEGGHIKSALVEFSVEKNSSLSSAITAKVFRVILEKRTDTQRGVIFESSGHILATDYVDVRAHPETPCSIPKWPLGDCEEINGVEPVGQMTNRGRAFSDEPEETDEAPIFRLLASREEVYLRTSQIDCIGCTLYNKSTIMGLENRSKTLQITADRLINEGTIRTEKDSLLNVVLTVYDFHNNMGHVRGGTLQLEIKMCCNDGEISASHWITLQGPEVNEDEQLAAFVNAKTPVMSKLYASGDITIRRMHTLANRGHIISEKGTIIAKPSTVFNNEGGEVNAEGNIEISGKIIEGLSTCVSENAEVMVENRSTGIIRVTDRHLKKTSIYKANRATRLEVRAQAPGGAATYWKENFTFECRGGTVHFLSRFGCEERLTIKSVRVEIDSSIEASSLIFKHYLQDAVRFFKAIPENKDPTVDSSKLSVILPNRESRVRASKYLEIDAGDKTKAVFDGLGSVFATKIIKVVSLETKLNCALLECTTLNLERTGALEVGESGIDVGDSCNANGTFNVAVRVFSTVNVNVKRDSFSKKPKVGKMSWRIHKRSKVEVLQQPKTLFLDQFEVLGQFYLNFASHCLTGAVKVKQNVVVGHDGQLQIGNVKEVNVAGDLVLYGCIQQFIVLEDNENAHTWSPSPTQDRSPDLQGDMDGSVQSSSTGDEGDSGITEDMLTEEHDKFRRHRLKRRSQTERMTQETHFGARSFRIVGHVKFPESKIVVRTLQEDGTSGDITIAHGAQIKACQFELRAQNAILAGSTIDAAAEINLTCANRLELHDKSILRCGGRMTMKSGSCIVDDTSKVLSTNTISATFQFALYNFGTFLSTSKGVACVDTSNLEYSSAVSSSKPSKALTRRRKSELDRATRDVKFMPVRRQAKVKTQSEIFTSQCEGNCATQVHVLVRAAVVVNAGLIEGRTSYINSRLDLHLSEQKVCEDYTRAADLRFTFRSDIRELRAATIPRTARDVLRRLRQSTISHSAVSVETQPVQLFQADLDSQSKNALFGFIKQVLNNGAYVDHLGSMLSLVEKIFEAIEAKSRLQLSRSTRKKRSDNRCDFRKGEPPKSDNDSCGNNVNQQKHKATPAGKIEAVKISSDHDDNAEDLSFEAPKYVETVTPSFNMAEDCDVVLGTSETSTVDRFSQSGSLPTDLGSTHHFNPIRDDAQISIEAVRKFDRDTAGQSREITAREEVSASAVNEANPNDVQPTMEAGGGIKLIAKSSLSVGELLALGDIHASISGDDVDSATMTKPRINIEIADCQKMRLENDHGSTNAQGVTASEVEIYSKSNVNLSDSTVNTLIVAHSEEGVSTIENVEGDNKKIISVGETVHVINSPAVDKEFYSDNIHCDDSKSKIDEDCGASIPETSKWTPLVVVVSCPHTMSLSGRPPFKPVNNVDVFDVFKHCDRLQREGLIRTAFDRPDTSNTDERDDDLLWATSDPRFTSDPMLATLSEKQKWDRVKQSVRSSVWFQSFKARIKASIQAIIQAEPGWEMKREIKLVCIEGGPITELEQECMSDIVLHGKKDARLSSIADCPQTIEIMSYWHFRETYP